METPIKMDDLGVPLFSETSIFSKICFSGDVLLFYAVEIITIMKITILPGIVFTGSKHRGLPL